MPNYPTALNSPKLIKCRYSARVTRSLGINYKHKEDDFVDFTIQKLLPHKLSEYTPGLAVGDV